MNSQDPLFNKKRQLNRRGVGPKIKWRHKLSPKSYELKNEWEEELEVVPEPEEQNVPQNFEPKKKTLGVLWAFLGVATLFFIGAVLFAYLSYTQGRVGVLPGQIVITTDYPISVASGELFEIDFTIQNKNQLPIESVELVLEFPEGTSSAIEAAEGVRRARFPIGDIQAGGFAQHTESLRFFGESDQRMKINAILEYKVPSSGTVYEIPKVIESTLTSSPIRITIDALESLTAGQTLTFDISVESNAAEVLEDVILKAEYPFGFSFIDSSIPPSFTDHIWKIDKLEPNEAKHFEIRGTLAGQNKEERRFFFEAGFEDKEIENGIKISLSDVEHFVTISKPFLEFDLVFDGERGEVFVRNSAQGLFGTVELRNTTNQPIRDTEVKLTLNEPIYDKFKVTARNGFFDSAATIPTLKWNEQTLEDLSFIAPGQGVQLLFEIGLLSSVRDDGSINKNPEFTLNASITGERSSEQGADEVIETDVLKKVILQTVPALTARTLFNSGKILNSGPLPPVIEQETTFEVEYDLRNTSSDIQNGQVKTELPPHAVWKGVVSPPEANVRYNDITREVVWNVGSIDAGVGYIQSPRKVSFQVGVIPSPTQVKSEINLIEQSTFVGYDVYTETNVSAIYRPVSTIAQDLSPALGIVGK